MYILIRTQLTRIYNGDKFSNKGDEFRKSLNASDKLVKNSTKTI